MAWYDKYLSIYGKPFSEVPQEIIDGTRERLAALQSDEPLVSIVVIAYNEECRLTSCLWSLSEMCSDYPIELLGVNNNSKDRTEDVYKSLGLPYFNEPRQSPGYARQCGLDHAKGKYYFCIDADTCYPSQYINLMMKKFQERDVACVSSFWSFFSDQNHSKVGLHCYEFVRDVFLFFQHFNRPELCVRGMVFAFRVEYARQVQIRTDIRRGEDGSLALSLKKFGRIVFLYNRKARPVTGYGTIGNQSILKSFIDHAKIQGRGLTRIFHKTDHYEDTEDNLVKRK
jgi:glycosyltransferase involved in cell wall biosynthesis